MKNLLLLVFAIISLSACKNTKESSSEELFSEVSLVMDTLGVDFFHFLDEDKVYTIVIKGTENNNEEQKLFFVRPKRYTVIKLNDCGDQEQPVYALDVEINKLLQKTLQSLLTGSKNFSQEKQKGNLRLYACTPERDSTEALFWEVFNRMDTLKTNFYPFRDHNNVLIIVVRGVQAFTCQCSSCKQPRIIIIRPEATINLKHDADFFVCPGSEKERSEVNNLLREISAFME